MVAIFFLGSVDEYNFFILVVIIEWRFLLLEGVVFVLFELFIGRGLVFGSIRIRVVFIFVIGILVSFRDKRIAFVPFIVKFRRNGVFLLIFPFFVYQIIVFIILWTNYGIRLAQPITLAITISTFLIEFILLMPHKVILPEARHLNAIIPLRPQVLRCIIAILSLCLSL